MSSRKPVSPTRKDPNADLKAAIRRTLVGGARPDDVVNLVAVAGGNPARSPATIRRMVSDLRKQLRYDVHSPLLYNQGTPPDESGFLDPANLPDGAVLLKDIARDLSISPQAIRQWIDRGRMQEVGRVGGKGSGIGGFVVVKRADVLYCLTHPRKGGRPRKKPEIA